MQVRHDAVLLVLFALLLLGSVLGAVGLIAVAL